MMECTGSAILLAFKWHSYFEVVFFLALLAFELFGATPLTCNTSNLHQSFFLKDFIFEQARQLDVGLTPRLAATLQQESPATVAGLAKSLAVLRCRELLQISNIRHM